jgi:hypothetical protein
VLFSAFLCCYPERIGKGRTRIDFHAATRPADYHGSSNVRLSTYQEKLMISGGIASSRAMENIIIYFFTNCRKRRGSVECLNLGKVLAFSKTLRMRFILWNGGIYHEPES